MLTVSDGSRCRGHRGGDVPGWGWPGQSGRMPTTVWVDGRLGDDDDATVSALDHGIVVGDGVFETCKATPRGAFALSRHLRRLARSAAGLGIAAPDEPTVRRAVAEVLDHQPMSFGRLRITWTSGRGGLGSDRGVGTPTLVVAASPSSPWGSDQRAVSVPWTRNERAATAGLKTTSYAENVIALEYAHARGAAEALFANTRGELCEGTGSNVVLVLDGKLVTPPLTSGCLAGITRELALEWAAQEGRPVAQRVLTMADLARASAVMLTSSTRDVQHLTAVDGRELASSDEAAWLSGLFTARAAEDVDP